MQSHLFNLIPKHHPKSLHPFRVEAFWIVHLDFVKRTAGSMVRKFLFAGIYPVPCSGFLAVTTAAMLGTSTA